MNTTINLPLYQMPDSGIVDLRIVRVIGPMREWEYPAKRDYFRVYYNENQDDTFEGEFQWLSMQRNDLIKNWNRVIRGRGQAIRQTIGE